jgi:hypothetical protein
MDETGNPANKTQQISGPEVATLVNAPTTTPESPVGSNDVSKSAVESTSSVARRKLASIKSSDPKGIRNHALGAVALSR